jgi:hypothetical protein
MSCHDDKSLCPRCNSYVAGEHQAACPFGSISIEVPKVSPENRCSLWNACYAVMFRSTYLGTAALSASAAGQAADFADVAVWALTQHDKKEAHR